MCPDSVLPPFPPREDPYWLEAKRMAMDDRHRSDFSRQDHFRNFDHRDRGRFHGLDRLGRESRHVGLWADASRSLLPSWYHRSDPPFVVISRRESSRGVMADRDAQVSRSWGEEGGDTTLLPPKEGSVSEIKVVEVAGERGAELALNAFLRPILQHYADDRHRGPDRDSRDSWGSYSSDRRMSEGRGVPPPSR